MLLLPVTIARRQRFEHKAYDFFFSTPVNLLSFPYFYLLFLLDARPDDSLPLSSGSYNPPRPHLGFVPDLCSN